MGYLSTNIYARHCAQGVLEYINGHVLLSGTQDVFG